MINEQVPFNGNENASQTGPENYQINLDALDQESPVQEQPQEGQISSSLEEIEKEAAERYKNLPKHEALIRAFQSRYDKLSAEYNKMMKEYERVRQAAELLETMTKDEAYLAAFLNEVKPEFAPKIDIQQIIKSKLEQEFGPGYKPRLSRQEAEIEDPGGKDWRYYKRLDELYNEYKNLENRYPKNFRELKEKREQELKKQAEEYAYELEKIKKEFNATDDEVKSVFEFWQNVKPRDLFKIHRFLRKFPNYTIDPTKVSPSTKPGHTSMDRARFLSEL